MSNIINELGLVQEEVFNGFRDPFPDNSLSDFIISGSKFIRSKLAILYLKSQNIEIKNEINKVLAAGEIIHNASLLHDDVIDNAETRRNFETFAKKFNSKVSILAGDYLLAQAIEKILSLNNLEILEKFKNCTKRMTEAEIKQFFLRGVLPSNQEYLEICKGKTASLFSIMLETTSELSGLDGKIANFFGEIFGICFQIKNDLEINSAKIDKNNQISTAEDILGIENTNNLLDNYKEEMCKLIKGFPENIYKRELEDLINLI